MKAMRDVLLQMGQFHFAAGPGRVRTVLGSCVAITMWRPEGMLGGMCHYMLPAGLREKEDARPPGLYAEKAIELFVKSIHKAGTRPHDYIVKLFGGGRMFSELSATSCGGICSPSRRCTCNDVPCRNVLAGREMLAAYGFTIAAEHVGGQGSRDLILDLENGDVWLRRGSALAGERLRS